MAAASRVGPRVRILFPPAESHANLGPSTPAGLGRLPLPPHGALMPSANFVFATRSARAEPEIALFPASYWPSSTGLMCKLGQQNGVVISATHPRLLAARRVGPEPTQPGGSSQLPRRSLEGHPERFPPTRLSAGCGFRKETIAGTRRNGRDAPVADISGIGTEPLCSTQQPQSPAQANRRICPLSVIVPPPPP